MEITAEEIHADLMRRATGQSRWTSQRREAEDVQILSGVFEGKTTGTPIALVVYNTDARPRDYSKIADRFRPGHADYTWHHKYGIRDYRGGGRSSARETAMRVAAGDRKSTRLNSSHVAISYAVFCWKKEKARRASEAQHRQAQQ